jgi:CheY-like chemotaxis protein
MNKLDMDLSPSKPKTILIVDDSAPLRAVVNTTLTAAGYQVLEADDGSSALPLLDGHSFMPYPSEKSNFIGRTAGLPA